MLPGTHLIDSTPPPSSLNPPAPHSYTPPHPQPTLSPVWLFKFSVAFVQSNLYLSGEWFAVCGGSNCKVGTSVDIGIEQHNSLCQNQKLKLKNREVHPYIISPLSSFLVLPCLSTLNSFCDHCRAFFLSDL